MDLEQTKAEVEILGSSLAQANGSAGCLEE